MGTKNITLAIDEDLLDKARVLAAMRRTTVNAMVREFLAAETGEVCRDGRRAEWDALFARADADASERRKRMGGGLPSRAELYDEVMRDRGLF
jgi:hypothetical protein